MAWHKIPDSGVIHFAAPSSWHIVPHGADGRKFSAGLFGDRILSTARKEARVGTSGLQKQLCVCVPVGIHHSTGTTKAVFKGKKWKWNEIFPIRALIRHNTRMLITNCL